MSWCDDPLDLLKLLHWVFSDRDPPGGADAVYLFGEMPDSQNSVLGRGLQLYKTAKVGRIGLCYNRPDGGPYSSPLKPDQSAITYSGFRSWQQWLAEGGVKPDDVIGVRPLEAEPPNHPHMLATHLEAGGLAREARERQWQSVYLVDAPYHCLRAFVTTLKVIEREYPQLRVYFAPGLPELWSQERSYGQVPGEKKVWIDSLDDEWPRFDRYYQKGDIASCKEALAYLRQRDA